MGTLRVWLHMAVIRPLLRLFFGVNVRGREHLSDLKQFIIVANHNSHLDVFLLFHALPASWICRTHPVAAEAYFAKRPLIFRAINCLFRPVWVDRSQGGMASLEAMRDNLEQGHSLIIFPEGTRGEPGQIARFKTGIGQLATEFPDIPIVSVFLAGSERALPKDCFFPIPLWNHVTVGPPHVFTGARRDVTASLETLVRELAESDAAERHARPQRKSPCTVVAVLGIDGSGKSTVSRLVAERLSEAAKVCRVSDGLLIYEQGAPRDVQPLYTEHMREAIGAYAKTARSLKHYKVPKMAELLLRNDVMAKAERWYSPRFILSDGHPLLNLAAWSTLYKGRDLEAEMLAKAIHVLAGNGGSVPGIKSVFQTFPELLALQRLGLARMPLPDVIVVLDVDPAVCVERILRRGAKRQVHETEEKLGQLRDGYLRVCSIVEAEFRVPTLLADGGDPLETVVSSVVSFVREHAGGAEHNG